MTATTGSGFPTETGCHVDGHWGQYGAARVIMIAHDLGWDDAEAHAIAATHLRSMGPSTSRSLTDTEADILPDCADDAEAWLNEHAAAPGHAWGWHDGEFFYMPDTFWEDQ